MAAASCEPHIPIIHHQPGLLTLFGDGSFLRPHDLDIPACPRFVNGVASKDVVLNPSTGVWARIFLPQLVSDENQIVQQKSTSVPVVLHFHGGGFCTGSPATIFFHNLCTRLALRSRCIWVSVNYRLAPESPLPAAFDDAYDSLLWFRSQAASAHHGNFSAVEPWLARHADFSKCFLAGESAGGTIVHFLAVRVAAVTDWSNVRIRGMLLIHSAFTQARQKALVGTDPRRDFYHRPMVPGGAPNDHPFVNPLHAEWPKLSEIQLPPVFVAVAEKDSLAEGSLQYYEALKKAGKDVELFVSEREDHCFHLRSPPRCESVQLLEKTMIKFILMCKTI